jgi:Cu/Ag efflux protein CusF
MLACLVALVAAGSIALAQKPVTKTNTTTATATVQAIDYTARTVTLRNEAGEEDTFAVGPDVQRFNEIKVGDKVRMTYYESIAYSLRKPGDKTPPSTESAAVVAAKGKLPGATISQQMTTTVTVKSVDPKVPSITVVTADGRTVSRRVEQAKNLEGVKPGDRIDITYTQALVTSLERTK